MAPKQLMLLLLAAACSALPNVVDEATVAKLAHGDYLHPAHGRRLQSRSKSSSLGARRSTLVADQHQLLGDSADAKVSDLHLGSLQSEAECKPAGTGSQPEPILCTYKNLVLWSGDFYYLGSAPARSDWALKKMQLGGAKLSRSVGAPDSAPAVRVELAGLITPSQPGNFMSVFGLTLPTVHGVLCKHFGRCGHEEQRRPQLILANSEALKDSHERVVRQDWAQCLSKAPVAARNASSLTGKAVLMAEAFMLFEPACDGVGGAACKPWDYRAPPHKDDVTQGWRTRLGACLGHGAFDPSKHAPADRLNVLLVDRDYWAGRKILNVNEMVRNLQGRYPTANVSVLYPERLSLADQAAAYSDATLIIWVTGGSMANLIFAPHGAVVMHMGMKQAPDAPYRQAQDWAEQAVPTNLEVHQVVTKNPDRIILRSYWIYRHPDYEALTDDEKLAIWELKLCPGKPGDAVNQLCEDVWIGKGGEFEMEFGFLWEAMDKFMPRLVEQRASS